MLDKLLKLKEMKDKASMEKPEQKAKMDVMKNLSDMAGDAMRGKLKGMKKVSVMSDSPSGLTKGLDKAKEMLDGSPEEELSENGLQEEKEHSLVDSLDDESVESEHEDKESKAIMDLVSVLSPQELDKHIKLCQELAAKQLHE